MFEPLPVVLVADDPLVRGGLAALLPDIVQVVRAVATDAVDQIVVADAHAIVWDADDVVPTRTELDLGLPVVLLVRSDADASRATGAAAVLRRDVDAERLGAALVAVRAGLRCIDDRLVEVPRPPAPMSPPPGDGPREPLTAREVEVLGLLAEGRSNREIAIALEISVHTAKFHVDRILLKLEASSL